MDITSKIERVKTEVAFLIQGAGDIVDKKAALMEIGQFTADAVAEQEAVEAAAAAEIPTVE